MSTRWDVPRGEHTDWPLAAAGEFAEVLKNLFLPFHLHDSYGEHTASQAMQYLQRISYTRDVDTRKIDLSGLTPHGTRFTVVFDNGDRDPSSGPYVSIRLDQLHGSSRLPYRASVVSGARSNIIAEARIALTEVKAITIRRQAEDDYSDTEGYGGYPGLEDEYTYEVTIRLQPTSNFYPTTPSRRFIPGAFMASHPTTSRCLKDLTRHADTIKFHIKAPTEAWTCLRRLQRNLGLHEERHNSTHSFHYELDHILRPRMTPRRDRDLSPVDILERSFANNRYFIRPFDTWRDREYEGRGSRRYRYNPDLW
ncbi:hypothetical protein TWF696_005775 [Orbilia brochopaga]|uniref:Uncharacterized protein n=1 Tax=Orbilia brochopaga TaxID=3140254 RepID=A0AAV9UXI7_9PEZI